MFVRINCLRFPFRSHYTSNKRMYDAHIDWYNTFGLVARWCFMAYRESEDDFIVANENIRFAYLSCLVSGSVRYFKCEFDNFTFFNTNRTENIIAVSLCYTNPFCAIKR